MMNIDKIINTSITSFNTLTEAENEESKYGIPDEVFSGEEVNDEPDNVNDQEVNDVPPNDTGEESDSFKDELFEDEQPENEETQEEEPTGEDQQGEPQEGEEVQDEQNQNNNVSEEQDNINSIPKMEILNLSDKDVKINNLLLIKRFNKLSKSVEDILNNNIMNITFKDKKYTHLASYVSKNLNDMIEDINNYVLYKFDDVYEENVVVYNAFLKRYHIAMQLIRGFIDEDNKSE